MATATSSTERKKRRRSTPKKNTAAAKKPTSKRSKVEKNDENVTASLPTSPPARTLLIDNGGDSMRRIFNLIGEKLGIKCEVALNGHTAMT